MMIDARVATLALALRQVRGALVRIPALSADHVRL
jgi:hypothetical protein